MVCVKDHPDCSWACVMSNHGYQLEDNVIASPHREQAGFAPLSPFTHKAAGRQKTVIAGYGLKINFCLYTKFAMDSICIFVYIQYVLRKVFRKSRMTMQMTKKKAKD